MTDTVGIVYDLQAYTFSPHGGIARIFDETFRAIDQSDSAWTAYLYHDDPVHRLPPLSGNIRHHPDSFYAHPLWKRYPRLRSWANPLLRAKRNSLGIRLFHPTFYPFTQRFPEVPTIINVYDLIHEHIPFADDMPDHQKYLSVKASWIDKAAMILCISEATRDDLLERYDPDPNRVRVIPLGYSPAFHKLDNPSTHSLFTPSGKDPRKPFILYVGSRQRYKNFHRLLAAYGNWNHAEDVDLVVVGAQCRSEDRLLLDLCPNRNHVYFIGSVADADLCALYNTARGFVYPSLKEGFGIPLLEAIACDCPLLISDIPPFREVAGPLARYFDPLDIDSLLDEMDAFVATDKRPHDDSARQRILSRYQWDRCTAEIFNVYRELLENS